MSPTVTIPAEATAEHRHGDAVSLGTTEAHIWLDDDMVPLLVFEFTADLGALGTGITLMVPPADLQAALAKVLPVQDTLFEETT